MPPTRFRSFATLILASAALCASAHAAPASADEALHVLNRVAFGPAPGDLARVERIGVDAYLDEQLHPERLPLPPALRERLDALETPRLGQRELVAQYREVSQAARDDPDAGAARRRALFQRIALEAGTERLMQATSSPRQLQEVMVDFWFNHFNVDASKGQGRVLVGSYEREAIRPHALGRFRDLLGATAHHPAMLVYLDNWLSRGGGTSTPLAGLNENYARELMELHTLGVDAGYTQNDVTELARILTGWTLNPRGDGSGDSAFVFDPRRHDAGEKRWLGRRVAPDGQNEGERALDALAAAPATAHHIAYQLAQYFVADDPPAGLVDRLAKAFAQTDGDIAATLETLFDSAEFRGPDHRAAKFKTPYRYVVSSLRALGEPPADARPLLAALARLGMPLHRCATPDGYKNTQVAWLNPDAMRQRIDFAVALAAGRPLAAPLSGAGRRGDGAAMSAGQDGGAAGAAVDADALLATIGPAVTRRTRDVLASVDPAARAALVLGSPDFLRH